MVADRLLVVLMFLLLVALGARAAAACGEWAGGHSKCESAGGHARSENWDKED
jgi:hypothetical protein